MSNNAASCDNNPLEINNVNTLECVPQKHPGAYELQVEPTDNESTDDASNSTVTEYTLKMETLLSNNDACLESVSSKDNSINAVIIDDDDITEMEAEPLPLIMIKLMDDVWCKSNAEKKKLVTVRLHESRISYVTKVLFVSSKRKQTVCSMCSATNRAFKAHITSKTSRRVRNPDPQALKIETTDKSHLSIVFFQPSNVLIKPGTPQNQTRMLSWSCMGRGKEN